MAIKILMRAQVLFKNIPAGCRDDAMRTREFQIFRLEASE
jgi:hypothetical protein